MIRDSDDAAGAVIRRRRRRRRRSSEGGETKKTTTITSEVAKSGVVTKAATTERGVFKGKPEVAAAKEATEKGDMTGMCPPSKLGQFYEFLSFSHLTPPIQFE
jgi:protein TIF31